MFATGPPIDTAPDSVTSAADDQTVVSVGPYRFVTARPPSASERASDTGNASPPTSTRSPAGRPPASHNACHRLGVACINVAPDSRTRAPSATGSRTTSRGASTTRAPCSNGRNNSRPAMSNPTVVTAANRSPSPSTNRSCIAARKFTSAPCGTATPFGRPVDPDV